MFDSSPENRNLYSLAGGLLAVVVFLASIFFGGLMAGTGSGKKLHVQVEAPLTTQASLK